jgi:hypothetical protein
MGSSKWHLQQTKQCSTCPWIVGADLSKIPNYDPALHEDLESTIAKPGELLASDTLRIMGCHHGYDRHCIGWLVNQLTVGNNIPMRIKMLTCENAEEIELAGKQINNFEKTKK